MSERRVLLLLMGCWDATGLCGWYRCKGISYLPRYLTYTTETAFTI